MKTKKLLKVHVEAIDRSISAKQTALESRHIPRDVKACIQHDIVLLKQIKAFIYEVLSTFDIL